MRRTPLIPVAVAAVSLLATAFAPAADAADPEVVADALVSALSVAVADDGTVYVSQNFASTITQVAPGGEPEPIFADEGHREVGGLSVAGDVLTFTTTSLDGPPSAHVHTLTPGNEGREETEIADTWAFEKAQNPDGRTTYGISRLSKSCRKDIPRRLRAVVLPYRGIKESHPYATTSIGDTTYVADAAANAIFSVDGSETISTVAVLPPVKVQVTKRFRKSMRLPKCTQGKVYKGEPVPTDVEVGPDGNLYVTTLGGGLGESMPVGALYKITTAGTVTKEAGRLMSPTGVGISNTGTAYVSMLFADTVLTAPLVGEPSTFAEIPFPGDVEIEGDSVYVTRTGLTDPPEGPFTGAVLKYPAAVG